MEQVPPAELGGAITRAAEYTGIKRNERVAGFAQPILVHSNKVLILSCVHGHWEARPFPAYLAARMMLSHMPCDHTSISTSRNIFLKPGQKVLH